MMEMAWKRNRRVNLCTCKISSCVGWNGPRRRRSSALLGREAFPRAAFGAGRRRDSRPRRARYQATIQHQEFAHHVCLHSLRMPEIRKPRGKRRERDTSILKIKGASGANEAGKSKSGSAKQSEKLILI